MEKYPIKKTGQNVCFEPPKKKMRGNIPPTRISSAEKKKGHSETFRMCGWKGGGSKNIARCKSGGKFQGKQEERPTKIKEESKWLPRKGIFSGSPVRMQVSSQEERGPHTVWALSQGGSVGFLKRRVELVGRRERQTCFDHLVKEDLSFICRYYAGQSGKGILLRNYLLSGRR